MDQNQLIEALLLAWINNTDLEEDQIIKKVVSSLKISTKKVAKIMNSLDF